MNRNSIAAIATTSFPGKRVNVLNRPSEHKIEIEVDGDVITQFSDEFLAQLKEEVKDDAKVSQLLQLGLAKMNEMSEQVVLRNRLFELVVGYKGGQLIWNVRIPT